MQWNNSYLHMLIFLKAWWILLLGGLTCLVIKYSSSSLVFTLVCLLLVAMMSQLMAFNIFLDIVFIYLFFLTFYWVLNKVNKTKAGTYKFCTPTHHKMDQYKLVYTLPRILQSRLQKSSQSLHDPGPFIHLLTAESNNRGQTFRVHIHQYNFKFHSPVRLIYYLRTIWVGDMGPA